jgi:hypothetical protein
MNEIVEFRTRDMALAACLMVDGVRYIRKEQDDGDAPKRSYARLVFIFEYKPEIERIISERANGTHVVSSVNYDEKLRTLKTIIHQQDS